MASFREGAVGGGHAAGMIRASAATATPIGTRTGVTVVAGARNLDRTAQLLAGGEAGVLEGVGAPPSLAGAVAAGGACSTCTSETFQAPDERFSDKIIRTSSTRGLGSLLFA
jgi:hypothetical protein